MDPTLTVVSGPLPEVNATTECASLGPAERVLSVGPEGHIWLVSTPTAGMSLVRVFDGWAPTERLQFDLPLGRIDAGQALTATTASVLADDALWFIADGGRVSVSAPFSLGAGGSVCGDLRSQGFVLTGGALYQRTEDQWLEWSGVGEILADGRILDRDGECFGIGDEVWLSTDSVAVWALSATALTRTATVPGASQPAVRDGQLLLLNDGRLRAESTDPHRWSFAFGRARLLGAAGAYGWLVIDDEASASDTVARFDGTDFERLELAGVPNVDALYPYASGGAWLTAGDQLCHVAPPTMLRIAGVRNGERTTASSVQLRAMASDGDASIQVSLDGFVLTPDRVQDGWLVYDASVSVGWHRFEVATSTGDLRRSVDFKRQPLQVRGFEADIRPIYEQHCSAANCHVVDSPSGAPDLSSYEAWRGRADRIRTRVVDRQDMPPAASRGPQWGQDLVDVINEWLNGGLRP